MQNETTLKKMAQSQEDLLLVDSKDQVLGSIEKITAHQGVGKLHRAFTVFLQNSKDEWLITQRSAQKPLWPLWWDGACSSHPWYPDETAEAAVLRRLPFELGTTNSQLTNLRWSHSYEYHAVYSEEWSENEINHIFVANYDGILSPNSDEVADHQWLSSDEITHRLSYDHYFAPWFTQAWQGIHNVAD